jgi:hypothetical protein
MAEVRAEIAMPEGDVGAVRDAAAAFMRIAGGMEFVGGIAVRAASVVYAWDGLAAMEFHGRTLDYQRAAQRTDACCTQAARAIDDFADQLAQARQQISRLQDEGEVLLRAEAKAQADAAAASSRLSSASSNMRQASMAAVADGGAAQAAAQAEVSSAQSALDGASSRAAGARSELDGLKAKAAQIRERVEHEAQVAAHRVRGVIGDLPTVVGQTADTVGDTPTRSNSTTVELGASVFFISVGTSDTVVKERRADGTWRVTLIDGTKGGLRFDRIPGAGSGTTGRLGGGTDVEGAFYAQFEKGETYQFSSEEDADRFVEYHGKTIDPNVHRYEDGTGSAITGYYTAKGLMEWANSRKPVEVYGQAGVEAEGGVSSMDAVRAAVGAAIGVKRDTASGIQTTYGKLEGEASYRLLNGVVRPNAAGAVEVVTAVSRAHDGTLTSATFTASAGGSAGVDLAGEASHHHNSIGLTDGSQDGVRVERQWTLDLHDEGNRRAVEAVIDSGGTDPVANAQLAARVHDQARVEMRFYDTGSSSSTASVDTARAGVEVARSTERSTLTGLSHVQPGARRWVHDVL